MKLVYFIQRGQDGPIKIGVTENIRTRFNTLQTHMDESIHLRAAFCGDSDTERGFHEKFVKFHKKGEWFYPNQLILDCISEINKRPDSIDVSLFDRDIEFVQVSQKGIFFAVSDDEAAHFRVAVERRIGRELKRGDLTKAGQEALQLWVEKYGK